MSKILKVRNVNDYARYVGCKEQHPLVCVIDYAGVSPVRHSLNDYGVYGIFFHDEAEIDLAYGCGKYDYKKGTVICGRSRTPTSSSASTACSATISKTASSIPSACPPCSIAQTGSVCRPTISAMSSRRPPATQRAATSASSSFS